MGELAKKIEERMATPPATPHHVRWGICAQRARQMRPGMTPVAASFVEGSQSQG